MINPPQVGDSLTLRYNTAGHKEGDTFIVTATFGHYLRGESIKGHILAWSQAFERTNPPKRRKSDKRKD